MARLAPGNLYQRILDEAQQRRRQSTARLAQQITRIEGKGNGITTAQEQRPGQQDDETGARRTQAL